MTEAVDKGGAAPAAKTHDIETIETLHRTYKVEAPDRDTAIERLRAHWKDPEALRAGLVTRLPKEEVTAKQVRQK